MARKFSKPQPIFRTDALYNYAKPSARCPMCNGKLFEAIWHNGERVYTTRPHCSSFTVYQKATVMGDRFAAQESTAKENL